MSELPLMHLDHGEGVIRPFRNEGYTFPARMIFAFITPENLAKFVNQYPHTERGVFETVSNVFTVYAIDVDGTEIGVCRAPLGAPAAVQLMEFLIAYGARDIIALGSCGVLTDTPENQLLVVTRALRDEGTSFHYLPAASAINLDADFARCIHSVLCDADLPVATVQTWTTDAFFRETPTKIKAALTSGYTVVEMECAALAACAEFRGVRFGQLLFTGDSLANVHAHDERNFGQDTQLIAPGLAARVLAKLQ